MFRKSSCITILKFLITFKFWGLKTYLTQNTSLILSWMVWGKGFQWSCFGNSLTLMLILVLMLKLVFFFLYFTKRKHFKNYEKFFLFHLNSSFLFRDFQGFVFFALPFHSFQIQSVKWNWDNYDVVNCFA